MMKLISLLVAGYLAVAAQAGLPGIVDSAEAEVEAEQETEVTVEEEILQEEPSEEEQEETENEEETSENEETGEEGEEETTEETEENETPEDTEEEQVSDEDHEEISHTTKVKAYNTSSAKLMPTDLPMVAVENSANLELHVEEDSVPLQEEDEEPSDAEEENTTLLPSVAGEASVHASFGLGKSSEKNDKANGKGSIHTALGAVAR